MKYVLLSLVLIMFVSCTPLDDADNTLPHGPHGQMMHMQVDSEHAFLVEMIPHHQEAIDTSRLVMQTTENPELYDLASRIVTAQEAEIRMMESWLTEMDGDHEASYTEMMPNLSALSGAERDVAYLQGMIRHHMMAVMMARQVLHLDPSDRVDSFARDVIEVQSAEIREMQALLRDY